MNASYGELGLRHGMRWASVRRSVAPLRTAFWAWSLLVALAIASGAAWSVQHGAGDWRVFVAAGGEAGSRALIEPADAWRIFVYPPAVAWAFVPFAHLPLAVSFTLNGVLMLLCAAAAGVIAARTYGLSVRSACAAYVLWPPVVYAAAIIGQNAPLGLLLAQAAIAGFVARSNVLTAVPVGLLLYKPTYALPFVALLALRRRWNALVIVGCIGAMWYAASAIASGGAWDWPAVTAGVIARYAPGDFSVNHALAIGLPQMLIAAGAAPATMVACCLAVALAAAVVLRRVEAIEAASAASLAGLALSAHAWAYDAALALPMLAFVVSRLDEPVRTRALVAAAPIAPLFFVAPQLHVDPLAVLVVGGTLAWIAFRLWRPAPAAGSAPA